MSKEQNKNKILTSASRTPDLWVRQSFGQDQFPTQSGFTPNELVLCWAKALDKTVKVTAVSIRPGETCSEATLIIQFRSWISVVTWDLSSGFTNKLDPNYGQIRVSFAEMPKWNVSSKKHPNGEKKFCFPDGWEWHPSLTRLLTLKFFLQSFLEFRVIYCGF